MQGAQPVSSPRDAGRLEVAPKVTQRGGQAWTRNDRRICRTMGSASDHVASLTFAVVTQPSAGERELWRIETAPRKWECGEWMEAKSGK